MSVLDTLSNFTAPNARRGKRLVVRALNPRDAAASAIEALYRSEVGRLCLYLKRKYGAGPPEPADVAHQAFLRLSELLPARLEQLSHLKAFLYRVAENILLSEKRRHRTRARYGAEEVESLHSSTHFDADPEHVLVSKGELALVDRALRAMPARRRQCFLMHRMDELSFAEIGRRIGVSAPAARAHVERAFADIEAALAEHAPKNGPRS